MLRLLALALCASVTLAAPRTILPRQLYKWACPVSECHDYLLQGTDSCYNYCISGECNVRGVDCKAGCSFFCDQHCDDIAGMIGPKTPICKNGPLPQNPIQQAPANTDNIGLPPGYNIPSGTQPVWTPVTNTDSSFLPDSGSGSEGDPLAFLPLSDDNSSTDPGTFDLGSTFPLDDNSFQTADLSPGLSDQLGLNGFTDNTDNTDYTAFAPSGTDDNLLAFADTVPLDSDPFSNSDPFSSSSFNDGSGLLASTGSLDDFNSYFSSPSGGDGTDYLASNPDDSGYQDFFS